MDVERHDLMEENPVTEAFFMVVWCIPGDDVGVLHASALFVERKFPDASQQPDKAQKKIASAKWLHQTW